MIDSSKTGFLYKCPFRLNEGEFQRASFVSKNLKGREIKKRRIQMKEMKKWKRRGNEKLEVVGKRHGDRGNRKERKQKWGGSKLMRKGMRYRGSSRRDKERVANTSLGVSL